MKRLTLAWDVAGDVRDVAVVVCDLVNAAVVIGGDGALVALWPSVGACVGALHVSSRHTTCSNITFLSTFASVHGISNLHQSLDAACMA